MDRGNQQQRIGNRLYWLGGIIDGEGMVTVVKRSSKTRTNNGWNPKITVVNTDLLIINEVIDIMKEIKIPHYVHKKKNSKHPHWKMKYEIIIQGIKRCAHVAPKLMPYLVAKRSRMVSLHEWCKYRLSQPINSPYTETDERLIKLIKQDSPIMLRDYTPDFLGIEIEDIVRTDMKVLEPCGNVRPPDLQMRIWS